MKESITSITTKSYRLLLAQIILKDIICSYYGNPYSIHNKGEYTSKHGTLQKTKTHLESWQVTIKKVHKDFHKVQNKDEIRMRGNIVSENA
jgi:hypothetical protein